MKPNQTPESEIEFIPLTQPDPSFQRFLEYLARRAFKHLGLPPEFLDEQFHPDEQSFAE